MTKKSKIIFKSLIAALSTLLIFLFLPLIANYVVPTVKTDTFLLKNAQFASTDFSETTSERCDNRTACHDPISFHRLKKADGVILAVRKYDGGEFSTMDDETFEKITIWLNQEKSVGRYALNEPGIIAYYSRGGSAWPGSQCGAQIRSGTLAIQESTYENVKFTIEAEFRCNNEMKSRDIKINSNYDARVIIFDNLTPWLGKAGGHYYDESYRR